MNELVLILTGAGISLVSSVTVTWLQVRFARRSDIRATSRDAARTLTGVFIAERDDTSPDRGDGFLAEAELTVMPMADRKTRERLRDIIRLLRERSLPEIEELSGIKAARARQLLCDHALDVLGAHLRSERLPALPPQVQKMLDVEEEALNIHTGGASRPAPAAPIEKGSVTRRPRHTPRSGETSAAETTATTGTARGRSGKAAAAKTAKAAAASRKKDGEPEERPDSAFWND